jgi:hypothetical protein
MVFLDCGSKHVFYMRVCACKRKAPSIGSMKMMQSIHLYALLPLCYFNFKALFMKYSPYFWGLRSCYLSTNLLECCIRFGIAGSAACCAHIRWTPFHYERFLSLENRLSVFCNDLHANLQKVALKAIFAKFSCKFHVNRCKTPKVDFTNSKAFVMKRRSSFILLSRRKPLFSCENNE